MANTDKFARHVYRASCRINDALREELGEATNALGERDGILRQALDAASIDLRKAAETVDSVLVVVRKQPGYDGAVEVDAWDND